MANNIEEFESTDLVTMANVNEKISATNTALQALAQTVASGVKIVTGSYTGTGTYGESNPNTLTFEFEPKAIFMWYTYGIQGDIRFDNSLAATTYIAAIPADNVYYYGGFDNPNQTRGKIKRSIDGKTITWYSTNSSYQLNVSGYTYNYLVIG